MPYIQGKDRNQLSLTPMCLDDFVDENSVCRIIEAYVVRLDKSERILKIFLEKKWITKFDIDEKDTDYYWAIGRKKRSEKENESDESIIAS